MPLTATTLTLPSHKVELGPVATNAGLERMLEAACQGLSITPEQLHQELEENGDLPDLVSRALMPAALRLSAETLNTMWYAGEAPESIPAEARRRAVLSMLANEPGITYALTSDTEVEADAVIITLTMRDKAICELKIPKDRYDGLAMLQMIEKQTGESYAERTRDVSKLRTTHAGRDRGAKGAMDNTDGAGCSWIQHSRG
ncbi:MAG TPA: hypothetical protein VHJ19_13640 [Gammaproteobacteria bacterium]|nr:hypothetical protein [Gammaproteobacteria bacterium]